MPKIIKNTVMDFLINELEDRELQILFLMANGKTNADIGLLLHYSGNTIKADITTILKKLKVRNRTEAVYRVAKTEIFREKILLLQYLID